MRTPLLVVALAVPVLMAYVMQDVPIERDGLLSSSAAHLIGTANAAPDLAATGCSTPSSNACSTP